MKAKLLFLHLGILALFVSLFTSGSGLLVAQSDPFNVGPVRYGDFSVTGNQTINGTLTTNGPTLIPVGSLSIPSLTIIADTNTGLFSPGNGEMTFVSNGVAKFEIDAGSVLVREAQGGGTVADGWNSTSYVWSISNADVTPNQGNGLLVQGGAGSSSSNIARFNNLAGTRIFSVGGGGQVSVSSSGNLNVADPGGNTGNVPHECRRVTEALSAGVLQEIDCAAGEIVTGGGCSSTGGDIEDSFPKTDMTAWTCNVSIVPGTGYAICCAY